MTLNESVTGLSSRASGPDFLCIGQGKAGTGWLYDMLQFDPDFWTPPIKELKFFNDKFPVQSAKSFSKKMARNLERLNTKRRKSRKKPLDERDAEFIKHAITYKMNESSMDWYKKLFAPKANLVSGDITPANAILGSDVIASIAQALPDLRLVLLLRDPVSRVWSNFNMRQRRELTGRPSGVNQPSADLVSAFQQDTSVEEVVKYLQKDRIRKVSFATSIYEKWNRHFDASQISIVFFEDICEFPESVIERFREDLGLPGALVGKARVPADFNRKAGRLKREMTDEVRALLVDTFHDEMLRCAEIFGGPAEHWPRRYGIA